MAFKRDAPRHQFIENHSQAPDVGSLIYIETASLFRRHVVSRAQNFAGICLHHLHRRCFRIAPEAPIFGEFSETEVEHFDVAISTDHDVVRLNITVHNAGGVCGGKTRGDLRS